ncbi:hypothetical protein BJ742DRAFT_237913 [Cladochytrium replicatum]|nr:hypothetical protein BJ742DRAFT_237913 [Cladochytrium replicatum]
MAAVDRDRDVREALSKAVVGGPDAIRHAAIIAAAAAGTSSAWGGGSNTAESNATAIEIATAISALEAGLGSGLGLVYEGSKAGSEEEDKARETMEEAMAQASVVGIGGHRMPSAGGNGVHVSTKRAGKAGGDGVSGGMVAEETSSLVRRESTKRRTKANTTSSGGGEHAESNTTTTSSLTRVRKTSVGFIPSSRQSQNASSPIAPSGTATPSPHIRQPRKSGPATSAPASTSSQSSKSLSIPLSGSTPSLVPTNKRTRSPVIHQPLPPLHPAQSTHTSDTLAPSSSTAANAPTNAAPTSSSSSRLTRGIVSRSTPPNPPNPSTRHPMNNITSTSPTFAGKPPLSGSSNPTSTGKSPTSNSRPQQTAPKPRTVITRTAK